MQKYKAVVVGMGKRGKHHAQAFQKNPRFELAGICDLDAKRLADATAAFPGVPAAADARELLKSVKPDVFCFCTMPNVRMPLIKLGIDAGAKMIAFEKPMAATLSEAIKIRDALSAAGVKGVVSHQHRYGVHYQKVKEIIASGAIGRVHTVYGHASGWMMHMMTHMIDYACWYNDYADATWVMGQAAGKGKFSDIHPSPDYIAGTIQFANGVRGIVEVGAGAPDVPEVDYWWRKCRIGAQGTEGFAEALTGGGWRAVTRDSNGPISGPGCMNYDLDMPPYVQDMAAWLDDDKAVHPCCAANAFKGFEIMMGICRSVVQRGQIALPMAPGGDDIAEMEKIIPAVPVRVSCEANRAEYKA